MHDYEAIAARLANALRDMLMYVTYGSTVEGERRRAAREALNDFDNWPSVSKKEANKGNEGNTSSDYAPYCPTKRS